MTVAGLVTSGRSILYPGSEKRVFLIAAWGRGVNLTNSSTTDLTEPAAAAAAWHHGGALAEVHADAPILTFGALAVAHERGPENAAINLTWDNRLHDHLAHGEPAESVTAGGLRTEPGSTYAVDASADRTVSADMASDHSAHRTTRLIGRFGGPGPGGGSSSFGPERCPCRRRGTG